MTIYWSDGILHIKPENELEHSVVSRLQSHVFPGLTGFVENLAKYPLPSVSGDDQDLPTE